jgi:diguanylate cyclase (GGDEF)-like protein
MKTMDNQTAADVQTPEEPSLNELSPNEMVQLICELQLQNKELQRSQAELSEALRAKDSLLKKANALLAESQQALLQQATNDPLTGLLNHRAALKLLSKELSRNKRRGEELAIGICDIDNFKAINNNWGHKAGNEVLCWLAQALTTSIREYDTVARLGGEGFLLIMPLKSATDAESVCERLCNQIANSKIETASGELSITVSLGVAYAATGSLMKGLLSEAAAALYQAKEQGRNRVVYFMKA